MLKTLFKFHVKPDSEKFTIKNIVKKLGIRHAQNSLYKYMKSHILIA